MTQIISANRLSDGLIVFLDKENKWVEAATQAAVFDTKESAASALARGQVDIKTNLVVDVAAIDMVEVAGRLQPSHLRDSIRMAGPTITPGSSLKLSEPSSSFKESPDVSI